MIRKPRTEKNFTSENETAMTNAACLNRIFKKVELEGLSDDAASELAGDIEHIAGLFGISPKAAVILAAILEKSGGNGCDDEDLANYIGCTNIEFFGFHDAIRELEDRCIISRGNGRRQNYFTTRETVKSIEKDCEFVPLKKDGLTSDEIFTRFRMLISDFRNDRIDAEKFIAEEDRLVNDNQQLLFCREALDSELYRTCTDTERRIFFYLCHRYVSHGELSVDIDTLMNLTEFMEDDARLKRHIANETTTFQQCGLVTFGNDEGYVDNSKLALSDDVRAGWFNEIELAPAKTVNHKDLIPCSSIREKELFYNEAERAQIERLTNLLMEDNFRQVQERLESQGMPKGFTAIFYGAPGAGKTASLYEIARRTGRDIFFVDFSALKSKWVGESEKQVKQLFDTYRNLVKTSEKAPILAFNEADAVFTKRITNVEQSVDQMNNAIADICLNELETLDGILIATTNLVGNMMGEKDNALERRFLFKIEFKTPAEDVRAKIWKSKLGNLSEEDAATLARRFTFSGGNIDNVARKSTVEYVLSGSHPSLDTVIRYCEEETISKKKASACKIGFQA